MPQPLVPTLMENGVHPSRAESPWTSEINGDLATDSSVFKPQMLGCGGSHEDGKWDVQKRTVRWENEVCLPPFSTQRMEENLEVNRKKEREKEIVGQRIRIKDFSGGSHQWQWWSQQHGFEYSSTWGYCGSALLKPQMSFWGAEIPRESSLAPAVLGQLW